MSWTRTHPNVVLWLTVMPKGPIKRVREFAEEMIAERGVRHGMLNLINVELGAAHSHGGATHRHLKPHH